MNDDNLLNFTEWNEKTINVFKLIQSIMKKYKIYTKNLKVRLLKMFS